MGCDVGRNPGDPKPQLKPCLPVVVTPRCRALRPVTGWKHGRDWSDHCIQGGLLEGLGGVAKSDRRIARKVDLDVR